MPYSFEWKDRLCIVSLYGTTNDSEVAQCDAILDGNEGFDKLKFVICDFSKVEKLDMTVEGCLGFAAKDIGPAKTNSDLKLALVVVTEEQRALANLYESEVSLLPWKVRIFGDMDEALAWCV